MLVKVTGISVIVLVLLYCCGVNGLTRDGKVVNTGTGAVQGSILTARDGRDYYAWHKIPFAKAPVGNLRFADPQPNSWSGIIDGREQGPKCAQTNVARFGPADVFGSEYTQQLTAPLVSFVLNYPDNREFVRVHPNLTCFIQFLQDCLHLNVFAPKQLHDDIIKANKPKRPVIVFIHGGGFVLGYSEMVGPSYFMDEDVIYVTLQYRLDILGFLTTGDKVARGNQGLKDQLMALKWIRKNIEHFGGDPNQILISGVSAGAASVQHHMLSPRSKGLFQKVLSKSGSALSTWGLITLERSLEKTNKTAATFNCPADNSQLLVDCLRNVSMEALLKSRVYPLQEEYLLFSPHNYDEGFVPTIEAVKDEETFLAEHPMKIISDGKAERVPFFIGQTPHEAHVTSAAFLKDPKNLEKFESELIPALKILFAIKNPNVEEITRKIKQFYVPEPNNLTFEAKVTQYVDLLTDAFFSLGIRETVRLQRKFSPTYFYIQNNTDVPVVLNVGLDPEFHGIAHGADMIFWFPTFGMEIKKGDKLYQYSKDLVSLVVQFAKDDSKVEFQGVQIPPVASKGPMKVVEFKPEGAVISPEPFLERMEFLRSLELGY